MGYISNLTQWINHFYYWKTIHISEQIFWQSMWLYLNFYFLTRNSCIKKTRQVRDFINRFLYDLGLKIQESDSLLTPGNTLTIDGGFISERSWKAGLFFFSSNGKLNKCYIKDFQAVTWTETTQSDNDQLVLSLFEKPAGQWWIRDSLSAETLWAVRGNLFCIHA